MGLEQDFIGWVHSIQPTLIEFNPGSVQQLQQLLFAPCYRKISPDKIKKQNFRTRQKSPEEHYDNEEVEENIHHENDINNSLTVNNYITDYKNKDNIDEKLTEVLPEERIFRVENVYVNEKFIFNK